MASYSIDFREQMVRKIMPPNSQSTAQISRDTGVLVNPTGATHFLLAIERPQSRTLAASHVCIEWITRIICRRRDRATAS